jgi:hypothetical protein
MRNDVHAAALKAAAKVAFSVAFLNGCGSAAEPAEEAATNENAIHSDGCPSTGCDALLEAAFPKPGDYQWEPVPQSKQVVACCERELAKHDAATKYRWDCCVAFDPETGHHASQDHGLACTPWGPPVPPAMRAVA